MRRVTLLALSALIFSATLTPLRSNDTTFSGDGYGPEPLGEFEGEESVIRMVSESIDIHFAKDESKVHCRFVFRSTKKSGDARQVVGFPDIVDSDRDLGGIRNIETRVNGEKVETKKEPGYFSHETHKSKLGKPPAGIQSEETEHWAFYTMEVTFPPDKDVIIERDYVSGNGSNAIDQSQVFDYTTETGAIWKGNIGQADFHVTLDGYSMNDLAFEDGDQKLPSRQQQEWCSPNRSEWTIVSPTEMKLTWKNFEPATHSTRRGIKLVTWAFPRK